MILEPTPCWGSFLTKEEKMHWEAGLGTGVSWAEGWTLPRVWVNCAKGISVLQYWKGLRGRVKSKQVLTKGELHGISYLLWWWTKLEAYLWHVWWRIGQQVAPEVSRTNQRWGSGLCCWVSAWGSLSLLSAMQRQLWFPCSQDWQPTPLGHEHLGFAELPGA